MDNLTLLRKTLLAQEQRDYLGGEESLSAEEPL